MVAVEAEVFCSRGLRTRPWKLLPFSLPCPGRACPYGGACPVDALAWRPSQRSRSCSRIAEGVPEMRELSFRN